LCVEYLLVTWEKRALLWLKPSALTTCAAKELAVR